jgi:excinuclease UvrABC ATPase subunit
VRGLPRRAAEPGCAARALSQPVHRDARGDAVDAARRFFAKLDLRGRELEIARDLLAEIRARLEFLHDVGLGYLALDRAAPTLSGGEAQRIRLAAQLGSNLQGVCYVLDEPTIGSAPARQSDPARHARSASATRAIR